MVWELKPSLPPATCPAVVNRFAVPPVRAWSSVAGKLFVDDHLRCNAIVPQELNLSRFCTAVDNLVLLSALQVVTHLAVSLVCVWSRVACKSYFMSPLVLSRYP